MTTTSPIPRPLRGSRIDVFYPVKPENVPSLSSLESAFQLQEYISLVIRLDVHDVDRIVSIPGKGKGESEGDSKVTVDEACWIYEQLRRLAQDLTHPLITNLQNECNRQTCPEMKAGEWLYLCVAHGNDGGMEQCCAIDYILHTIDSATALLNSPRAFPSRLSIPAPSYRHFSSLARRLGRIFAHAYFHHRALFEQAEAESSLYRRFEEIVARWNLVPREFLVIPTKEDEQQEVGRGEPKLAAAAVEILKNEDKQPSEPSSTNNDSLSSSLDDGTKPPGSGSVSPGRRFGRSRTDTMVFSEASAVVEELAKSPAVQPEPAPLELVDVEMDIANQDEEEEEEEEPSSNLDEPVFAVDEVEKAEIQSVAKAAEEEGENPAPPPPPSEDSEEELPIVSPSSSTAPSDPAPHDVSIVEDSPKKEEHFAEAQAAEIIPSEDASELIASQDPAPVESTQEVETTQEVEIAETEAVPESSEHVEEHVEKPDEESVEELIKETPSTTTETVEEKKDDEGAETAEVEADTEMENNAQPKETEE